MGLKFRPRFVGARQPQIAAVELGKFAREIEPEAIAGTFSPMPPR